MFSMRTLTRCFPRNRVLETGLRCSQYIPVETFSCLHRVPKSFSVQTGVTGLCNCEFRRCYAKKKKTSGVPDVEVSDEEEDEDDSEDDSEDEADQNDLDQGCKTVVVTVSSMRLDTILKKGLGASDKTVLEDFYAGKFRRNGEKVLKKAVRVREGDEIDVVKELFPENEDFLVVNRVVVKSIRQITPTAKLPVKLHVFKSLVIENYEDKWP